MKDPVLILLHPGFEELEACAPIDILRRGKLEVITASTAPHRRVTGRNAITLVADALLDEVIGRKFSCLVIPGGPGVNEKLRPDPRIRKLIVSHTESDGLLGAICAAPLLLHDAGILGNKKFTAHFSTTKELGDVPDQTVVVDGKLITSRGAGTATAFALTLLRCLRGPDVASNVAHAICYSEPA